MAKQIEQKIVTKKKLARLEKERIQKRYLTIGAISILVIVFGLIGFGLINEYALKPTRPVAKVNNEKISIKDFQTQVRFYRLQLIQQYQSSYQLYQMFASDENMRSSFESSLQQIAFQLDPGYASSIGSQVLDTMVNNLIVEQQAKELDISVSDEEVEEVFEQSFYYFPDGTPTPTITPTPRITSTLSKTQMALVTSTPTSTMTPTIEVTPTNEAENDVQLTPTDVTEPTEEAITTPTATATEYTYDLYQEELNQYVESLSEYDLNKEDIAKIIYNQLLTDKVFDKITEDLLPDQEQVWARHILVEDLDTANEVLAKLDEGEDWTDLAAEYSQDTSNKDSGGDLGWFSKGDMVSEFEESAFSLDIGEISEPVETEFGFHIIQVLGHEVRSLSASEFLSYRQKVYTEWLNSLNTEETVQKFEYWTEYVPIEPTIPAEINIVQ